MRTIHSTLFLFSAFLFLISCKKEDNGISPNRAKYQNGVWVLNEGNFGVPTGTIGFYSLDSQKYTPDVYSLENGGIPTGDVLQGIFSMGNEIRMIANNDNKVLGFIENTGKATSSFEAAQFNSPRSGLVGQNGNIYVSNWGPFDPNFNLNESFLLELNPNGSFKRQIHSGPGSEKMVQVSNGIFISNNFSNTIEFFGFGDTITHSIPVAFAPNEMVLRADLNQLWVICQGSFAGSDGALVEIDILSLQVSNTYPLGTNPTGLLTGGLPALPLYFAVDNDVHKWDLGASNSQIFLQDVVPNGIYGLEYLVGPDQLWVSDHNNYSGNGRVYIFDQVGNPKANFEAGILPNSFLKSN